MAKSAPVRAILALVLGLASLAAPAAHALETADGRVALHGFFETQLRWLSDGFDANNWYHSQWANTVDLELELDLLRDPIGPFDLVTGFARVEVRYECVFTGCGIGGTHRFFGDRASRAPARNWRDALDSGFWGDLPKDEPRERIHAGHSDLLTVTSIPAIQALVDFGATNLDATIAPVADDLFAFKKYGGTRESSFFALGPWNTESRIEPNGALRWVHDPTAPLPFRPSVGDAQGGRRAAQGLYVPSEQLLRHMDDFDDFDQNFTERELAWNHGAGQDEHELKELYLDIEMFDSQLWLRVGKQSIVWGKTELFRTTDQFNPQDIGLSSLPSLEESRLSLWSVRAVWSLYDIGPFQDVRLEVAMNLDDFEPTDLGRCGEPYTVWLICGKSFGLWGHGVLGAGLAGEVRPPNPWKRSEGIEVGGRIEWRWDRFSFAITDFWGYSDFPTLEAFHFYERAVDPRTGRPLDVRGEPLVPENALTRHTGNRQLFDIVCSATIGVAAALLPQLADSCLLDLLNVATPLGIVPPETGIEDPSPALALGAALAGSTAGQIVADALLTGNTEEVNFFPPQTMIPLIADVNDGPLSGFLGGGLGGFLTDEQEALLGCGPFYQTDCDVNGIDLFNAEASVLLQRVPFMEPQPPVGTRFVEGQLFVLPGARGPGDKDYDPGVDGTPPEGFHSEMAAVSENFVRLLAILGISSGTDPDCSLDNLIGCGTLQAVMAITGVQRPEIRAGGNGRFGRRDFLWSSGGEAQLIYNKRNVLGFSMDFAEDFTKTNWSFEFTWVNDDLFGSTTSRSLHQEGDAFNLTISVDRPTFVNFLNANRTLFMNAQFFLGYLSDYNESYTVEGPLSALATFAVATGYFQDRLLASFVVVQDFFSSSGGVLPQVTWRASQDFSFTVGLAIFYGSPDTAEVPLHQLLLGNSGGNFRSRTQYNGLSAIAERDEVFLRIRYTF